MSLVKVQSNRNDEAISNGTDKPSYVCIEEPDSVNLLIDGKDKVIEGQNPYNFTVDMRQNLYRARSARVSKCIIPLINNITPFNNQMQIKNNVTTTAVFTLQPAFYNSTTLSNEITAKINAQYVIDGIVDTVTTSFDPITKTFSIQSVTGKNFFILDSCSFITRGRFCAPFESQAAASAATKTTIYSAMAGLLYTRFLTIHSAQLNYYSMGQSLTSDPSQGQNIIAVLDVCSIYKDSDFDVSTPFSGSFASILTPNAPQLNVVNSQKNMFTRIDIQVRDEYGSPMQDVVNLGGVYPANTLGVSLWFEIKF